MFVEAFAEKPGFRGGVDPLMGSYSGVNVRQPTQPQHQKHLWQKDRGLRCSQKGFAGGT